MFEGKKTYIASIGALFVAVGKACTDYAAGGPIDINAVVLALIALSQIFLRKGIKTETT